ncbi:MAG: helix-turn-helix domain-containing protein [Phenylobacterium sp.]|nr:helix-turn-helix domain-containing protein [Phenylobacterium sp.]MDP3747812.1 helix-turn-helix domain-containing protein [Phenylobacterium sp.]
MGSAKQRANGPDPIDLQVGMQIRARRKSRGSSQSALAEAVGVSFQQVQ